MIQPTGQAVLARLGLLDTIVSRGARIDRLWFRTHTNRTLVDLHYAKVSRAWFGIGLHRGVLFEALYDAARAEPRVTVTTACDVRELRRDGARTYLIDAAKTEYGPFDLVIIADGALDAYADARRRHLRYYQRMTRWLTPFFQGDSRLLGWLRDWTFPVANVLPPLRNIMISTMAGVSMGFVARPLQLPPGR